VACCTCADEPGAGSDVVRSSVSLARPGFGGGLEDDMMTVKRHTNHSPAWHVSVYITKKKRKAMTRCRIRERSNDQVWNPRERRRERETDREKVRERVIV
jgi:hypothetical protein